MTRILVVGAGFSGSVAARELAEQGHQVLVIDKRNHIGGNAYDELDSSGVLIHKYGPHIFHTNSERIFAYLSQFTDWRLYEHRVLSQVDGQLFPFPINRTTINQLYNLSLDENGVKAYLERVRVSLDRIETSEDQVLASVGYDLYEKFFLNYTRKQWGLNPSELKAGVAARIPIRTNLDDRYFTDEFQSMPRNGYAAMFRNILDHPRICVDLERDYSEISKRGRFKHCVYTGPIDSFFQYQFGRLPYRSLRFEHEHLQQSRFQSVATVNYPNDYSFTRITEFKHITGQQHAGTSIVREYPTADGEPYYPVPNERNEALYKKYRLLAEAETNVTFVGRLAQYRYYNMDQVVGAALAAVKRLGDSLS